MAFFTKEKHITFAMRAIKRSNSMAKAGISIIIVQQTVSLSTDLRCGKVRDVMALSRIPGGSHHEFSQTLHAAAREEPDTLLASNSSFGFPPKGRNLDSTKACPKNQTVG